MQKVKEKLAARSGHQCCNPDCRAATCGPQVLPDKSINVGVAAHISAAAPGGLRYDGLLSAAQRSSIKNGIWLCQTCAKLIDSDERRYTIELLLRWRRTAEEEALRILGKAKPSRTSAFSEAERRVKRDLKLRRQMAKDFLKTSNEYSRRGQIMRPYEKFRYSRVIIHRIGDDCYPTVDENPGISSWFRIELFDFYHNGIMVVLRIERGVIGDGGQWAIIPYDADFDRSRFRELNIWHLGMIPFRNIRHYDVSGDEYYNSPHVYCAFADDSQPYEGFAYAVVGSENEYDWPLKLSDQLTEADVVSEATGRAVIVA
ncbi:MAG: hypothetical protein JWQ87_1034 [Candidatus Sulfotelmatobacter sp.]|nr:hypothetical protein [Candidatus Sulfotelmatobacter sp.]